MRDDRYKRAPAPRCWRKLMKALHQEADRLHPERIIELFEEALRVDVRRQLGEGVLSALAGSESLLPGVGLPLGNAPGALLAEIDARIRALPTDVANDTRARCDELASAVLEYGERWGRELNAHLAAERAADGSAIMSAYRSALPAACARALAALLSCAKPPSAVSTVDLDENLLPSGRGAP